MFDGMTIDRAWLAWTEDPKDKLARELKDEYAARRKGLAAAIDRLSAANAAMGAPAAWLARVDGLRPLAAAAGPLAAGVRADPAGAMDWVRRLAGRNPDSFLKPGEVRGIPGAEASARAFVLGPPRSRDRLRKNLANKKETADKVVYHEEADHDAFHLRGANRMADDAFFAAVQQEHKTPAQLVQLAGEELEQYQLGLPFDVGHQVTPADAARRAAAGGYFDAAQQWRRIDNDWLNTAAHIALWMQSSTNNTSLVLAIELLPAGKVLLMAADAQVGNWLSWADVRFPKPHAGVTADDLLGRTVLYKVGHHGSHNATLRRDGLEKMTDDGLVAMIPVNRDSVEAKGWAMPFPPMYAALRRQARGRVIRADEGVMRRPASTPAGEWSRFEAASSTDPLYIDYRVGHG